MNNNHQAIFNLYSTVVAVDDAIGAMDAKGDLVVIDMTAVNQEAERLQAEAQDRAEAREAIKTSVINKIATNLTSEEKLWLEENL